MSKARPLPPIVAYKDKDDIIDNNSDFPQIVKVKCTGCRSMIEPCLLAFKSGRWNNLTTTQQDAFPLVPDYNKPPKICIWRDLCFSCGKNEQMRVSLIESIVMKLPFLVDLIELPLPHGVRYKKRKKQWKPKKELENDSKINGVSNEKKLTALDILDKDRRPSPKDLRYMCMSKIVNGAFLYINEGRTWVNDKIAAEKNIVKVKSDVALAQLDVDQSLKELIENKNFQDEIAAMMVTNDEYINKTKREKDDFVQLCDRVNKKISSSKSAISSYIRNGYADKVDKEMASLKVMIENSEMMAMRLSEVLDWEEYIIQQKKNMADKVQLLRKNKVKIEEKIKNKKEILDDKLIVLARCEMKLKEPESKIKNFLDARLLHKGHLDEYMEDQIVDQILLRGKLTVDTMATLKQIALCKGPVMNLSEKKIQANEIRILSFFLHSHKIEKVILSFNKLKGEDLEHLMAETRINTALTEIDLSFNSLGPEGARYICKTLAVGQGGLRSLNLTGNKLGVEGTKALAMALADKCSLTSLNLFQNYVEIDGAIALSDALKTNTTLKVLNLRYNGLYPAGAIALTNMMKVNRTLTELNLTDNHIGPEGAAELARYMRGTLGSLLRSVGYDIKSGAKQQINTLAEK